MTIATAPRRQLTPLEPLLRRIETASELDPAAEAVGKAVRDTISPGAVKDALSGTWLGHAVHPMLTDVVTGSFLSATLLDLFGGDHDGRASRRLIGLGILAYAPTALTGINDWADTEPADETVRRTGLVHATTNLVALSLYTASFLRRRRAPAGSARGKLLAAFGATTLTAAGYLGGHMSLNKGVGPDQTVFDPGPPDWTPAADAAQLSDGRPVRVVVDDTPVLLLRDAEQVFAIHDRCSHRGCSLSEGSIEGDEIVCACHGSRFDRRDGSVKHGPASSAQPAFQVRERDGRIEVRLLSPATA
ncbi:MAG: Rieske 2Fe-2S domain-containing protein [Solirubrobacteraceae bacterium]